MPMKMMLNPADDASALGQFASSQIRNPAGQTTATGEIPFGRLRAGFWSLSSLRMTQQKLIFQNSPTAGQPAPIPMKMRSLVARRKWQIIGGEFNCEP